MYMKEYDYLVVGAGLRLCLFVKPLMRASAVLL